MPPDSIDVALTVAGEVACDEDLTAWTKTVRVETPHVCLFDGGGSGTFELQHVGSPPTVSVYSPNPGTCTLTATSDVTGHTAKIDLELLPH